MIARGPDRIAGKSFATRSEILGSRGMAATSHPLATQIALDILKADGTAVDAAIAANAALGLMEPTSNGIGGDLFALVWDAGTASLTGLNGSGRSPMSLSLEHLTDLGLEKIPPYGPLPVSVPGAVDGWFKLHDRFGSLPLQTLLEPTIRYAREGHPVTETIAHDWAEGVAQLSEWPGFSEQLTINGRAPVAGELWKNPNLGNTLEQIAQGGRDVFYRGEMAQVMSDYMAQQGGFVTRDDLAAHTGEWVDPVSTNYRGFDVWELPPNGQGIAALQILNLLEGFDIGSYGFGSPDHIHLFLEAKKLAFEDRARFYADMAFSEVPVDRLISKSYARQRRTLIQPHRSARRYDVSSLTQGDTVYLTVADGDGNMVSLIQSNYRGFGSGMTPPGLGFVFQDRGELFTLNAGHPNVYAPGKRPFHTIIPAFMTRDEQPCMSFGLMGGGMQPQGHAQIVMNMIDFGMGLQEAGDAPRVHHWGSSEPTGSIMRDGGEANLESGFSYDTIRELMRRGHKVAFADGVFGGYQAIYRDHKNGVYHGASESRKDGQAAGY